MSTEVIPDEDESILAYISGRENFIDERNPMTTPTSPSIGLETQTLYYKWDLKRAPAALLERFNPMSEALMEAEPASYLTRYGYTPIPSSNEGISYYRSASCSDEYLVLVIVSDATTRYRLVFHVSEHKSLVAWKHTYTEYLHQILTMPGILPEPAQPADMNMKITRLDRNIVRAQGGWY